MSRPMGRHRARRATGIHALRRPAVAATAAISSVSVAAAAYSTAASASASVAGTARANIALGAPAETSTALQAANAAVATNSQAQVAAANRAVNARAAADAKTRSAVAARAASAAKLRAEAAASAKAAVNADAAKKAAAKKAAAKAAAAKAAAAKRATPPATSRGSSPTYSGSPQTIASAMLGSYGWGQDQMGCLISLWNRESGWNVYASNPSSGAYGIPQSLPGYKMASAGADWRTNPATQIRWGLGYIRSTYGSPCGAWGHSQATGWY